MYNSYHEFSELDLNSVDKDIHLYCPCCFHTIARMGMKVCCKSIWLLVMSVLGTVLIAVQLNYEKRESSSIAIFKTPKPFFICLELMKFVVVLRYYVFKFKIIMLNYFLKNTKRLHVFGNQLTITYFYCVWLIKSFFKYVRKIFIYEFLQHLK